MTNCSRKSIKNQVKAGRTILSQLLIVKKIAAEKIAKKVPEDFC